MRGSLLRRIVREFSKGGMLLVEADFFLVAKKMGVCFFLY